MHMSVFQTVTVKHFGAHNSFGRDRSNKKNICANKNAFQQDAYRPLQWLSLLPHMLPCHAHPHHGCPPPCLGAIRTQINKIRLQQWIIDDDWTLPTRVQRLFYSILTEIYHPHFFVLTSPRFLALKHWAVADQWSPHASAYLQLGILALFTTNQSFTEIHKNNYKNQSAISFKNCNIGLVDRLLTTVVYCVQKDIKNVWQAVQFLLPQHCGTDNWDTSTQQ